MKALALLAFITLATPLVLAEEPMPIAAVSLFPRTAGPTCGKGGCSIDSTSLGGSINSRVEKRKAPLAPTKQPETAPDPVQESTRTPIAGHEISNAPARGKSDAPKTAVRPVRPRVSDDEASPASPPEAAPKPATPQKDSAAPRPVFCTGSGKEYELNTTQPNESLVGQVRSLLVKVDGDGVPKPTSKTDKDAQCMRSLFDQDGVFAGPLAPYSEEFPIVQIIPGSALGRYDVSFFAYFGERWGLIPIRCSIEIPPRVLFSTRLHPNGKPAEIRTWDFSTKDLAAGAKIGDELLTGNSTSTNHTATSNFIPDAPPKD